MIGCRCAVCRSDDPRDTRFRPSVLLDSWVAAPCSSTRDPTCAVAGAEVRRRPRRRDRLHAQPRRPHPRVSTRSGGSTCSAATPMPIFADARTLADLRRAFAYVFEPGRSRAAAFPRWSRTRSPGRSTLFGETFVPVPIHARAAARSLGYRVGRFAYLTDCSGIPDDSFALLDGLDVLVLERLAPSAASDALHARSRRSRRRRASARGARSSPTCATTSGTRRRRGNCPEGIELAYDGLVVEV